MSMHAPKTLRLARIGLMLGAAFLLGGCTRGMSDLRAWVAHQKSLKGAPIPPLPVIKTFETFTYQDQDKRDPFGPSPVEEQQNNASSGPRPDQNRPKQPLEMFALDSLKMVGTIGTGSHIQALIQDPGGVIHRVTVDEYMGQNYGRVTKVAPDHVDLVELVPNGNGGWMERPASIALGEK
ncbi:pilus assembly protein PilP [Dyella sp. A6]|uniref:pilus assembly protein PilP n=1 Tax=Dyella aluminiiresistens TaxID=3069105 RepID=UPI002E75D7F9|nr:pilus assembly protein PilP [Dyella sp. A6]